MSQPPPWDPGQSPNQGQPPDQGQPSPWPSGNQPSWPTGDHPPSWPTGDQPPSWPTGDQPSPWPSGDQPPSWSPGGPDQGQPPPWPPGSQPPYPGPGYTYGYGPQPPVFPRRYRFRSFRALIVLGIFIVFAIVASAISRSHDAVSTAPFPSASGVPGSPPPAAPGKVGSYFDLKDGSGNVYRVTLVKVIDPARPTDQFNAPDSGKRLVGAVFEIKARTGSPEDEDANNDAVLVGGNKQNYPADFDAIVGYTNFDSGTIHVAQGGTVTGAVTFQVPDGVQVSEIQWTGLSGFGSTVEWNVPG